MLSAFGAAAHGLASRYRPAPDSVSGVFISPGPVGVLSLEPLPGPVTELPLVSGVPSFVELLGTAPLALLGSFAGRSWLHAAVNVLSVKIAIARGDRIILSFSLARSESEPHSALIFHVHALCRLGGCALFALHFVGLLAQRGTRALWQPF